MSGSWVMEHSVSGTPHSRLNEHKLGNIDGLYPLVRSDVKSVLARMLNALVEKFNESIYLPHYIVIIPDKDIIVNAQVFDYGAWDTFEQAIRWLVSNIDGTVEVRKEDLKSKNPGALSPPSEPHLVWVKALVCLEILLAKSTYSLVRKFNTALEDTVADNKRSHILKVAVLPNNSNFNCNGNLTPLCMIEYWQNLDAQMGDFDKSKTDLLPMKSMRAHNPFPHNEATSSRSRFKWQASHFCEHLH